MSTVTIRLPEKLAKELDLAVRQAQSNRSDILREALEAHLRRRREAGELEKYKQAALHINQVEARALAEEDFLPGNEVWFAGEKTPQTWPAKKKRRR